MQPTNNQVELSLAALRGLDTHQDPVALLVAEPDLVADQLPSGLVERIERSPSVRADRLAEARLRLETGEVPTADDLADRMVGRLVCDRLR